MPIFIMLGLYLGLFICTLLFLKKTNCIKIKTKARIQQKTISKSHGKSDVKNQFKQKR